MSNKPKQLPQELDALIDQAIHSGINLGLWRFHKCAQVSGLNFSLDKSAHNENVAGDFLEVFTSEFTQVPGSKNPEYTWKSSIKGSIEFAINKNEEVFLALHDAGEDLLVRRAARAMACQCVMEFIATNFEETTSVLIDIRWPRNTIKNAGMGY